MSVRELSVHYVIACAAAEHEIIMVRALGGTDRQATEAYHRVQAEILRLARRPDNAFRD